MKLFNIKAKILGTEINTQIPGNDEVQACERMKEYVSQNCQIIYCTEEYTNTPPGEVSLNINLSYSECFLLWSVISAAIDQDDDKDSLLTILNRVQKTAKSFLKDKINQIRSLPEIENIFGRLSETDRVKVMEIILEKIRKR